MYRLMVCQLLFYNITDPYTNANTNLGTFRGLEAHIKTTTFTATKTPPLCDTCGHHHYGGKPLIHI